MEPGFRLSRAVGRAELDGTDTVVVIRDYTGRTPKEATDSAGPAPTPLLESGLDPEPAPVKPTTWSIRRPDEDEREAEALL